MIDWQETCARLAVIAESFDAIDLSDKETAHAEADNLVLAALDALGPGQMIAAQWRRLNRESGGFWYA
jgi:hypothetical protein